MKPIAELRKVGSKIGRKGMAELAQNFISEYDGSYKGAMKLCGQLSVIARMSTCDQYWNEKVLDGQFNSEFKIELLGGDNE